MQQIINAAIAADPGSENINYTLFRIEPGTFCTKSRQSTTELQRNMMPTFASPLHLNAIAHKEARYKHLFSAASNHLIIHLLLDATL